MEPLVDLMHRGKSQAPPPWVIWEALRDPWSMQGREWFDLHQGEIAPTIVEAERPHLVVWTSIWSDHPELRIRFDLVPAGAGSFVTWTLLGLAGALDEDDVGRRRYRLNQLISGRLRDTFDQ